MLISDLFNVTCHLPHTFLTTLFLKIFMNNCTPFKLATLAICFSSALAAHAGRPLGVDDASVNDKGAGHVEVWAARDSAKNTLMNLAPAYAPIDDLELSAVLTRDTTNRLNTQTLQAKWRITPTQEKGCNVAGVLGATRLPAGAGSAAYLSGNLSCNGLGFVNVHANLGVSKAKDVLLTGTWGLAVELPLSGWTPHAEMFGAERSKPTVQFGARTQLTKEFQLDGTLGRNNNQTVVSIGVKYQF